MSKKRYSTESCRPRPARRIRLLAGAVGLTWLPSFFLAVANAETTTTPIPADKPLLQWVLMLAFAILCCGIAFKNPKRSHMD